jgi:hypothetical protein
MNRARAVMFLFVGSLLPCALAGQAPTDLARAAQVRDRAIRTGDPVGWGQFTAPEFTVVDKFGRLLTRADQLTQVRRVAGIELADQPLIYIDGVRAVGTAEAGESSVCSELNFVVSAGGTVAIRRCPTDAGLKLEVWAKAGSGWQAIAAQYSPAS